MYKVITSGAIKRAAESLSTSAIFSRMFLMQASTLSLDLRYASLFPLLPIQAACIDSAPRLICSSFWISAFKLSILNWISDRFKAVVGVVGYAEVGVDREEKVSPVVVYEGEYIASIARESALVVRLRDLKSNAKYSRSHLQKNWKLWILFQH